MCAFVLGEEEEETGESIPTSTSEEEIAPPLQTEKPEAPRPRTHQYSNAVCSTNRLGLNHRQ